MFPREFVPLMSQVILSHPEVVTMFSREFPVAHWDKDLVLSVQCLGLLLWCRLDPCPGNFHMLQAWPKKKKKEREREMFSHIFFYKVCFYVFMLPGLVLFFIGITKCISNS